MDQFEHARGFALLEEALTVLFCLVDDIYQNVNPDGWRYESLKRIFGLGETLATALTGLGTRIIAKITAPTLSCLGRPQGRIKEPWAKTSQ
jgi:hypothetical protein